MKNCIYCSVDIVDERVVDICDSCMIQVWGEKMSRAILQGMEKEKEKGNMELWHADSMGVENTEKLEQDDISELSMTNKLNDAEEIEIVEQLETNDLNSDFDKFNSVDNKDFLNI